MPRRIEWIVLAAIVLVPGCKKKRKAEEPPVAELKAIAEPGAQTAAEPVPEKPAEPVPEKPAFSVRDVARDDPAPPASEPAVGRSRNVPSERGVPLDRTAVGSLPHPFGALEVIKPQSTREDILSALPNAQRDGEDGITVPVGVDDLVARIDIDYTGHLDVVRIQLPESSRAVFSQAWGKPNANGTWFDRKRRWRADLSDSGELMIGPFVPVAELIGRGPDGLAETKAIVGATPAELTARFGARAREHAVEDDDGKPTGEKRIELLLPATDVCMYYSNADAELAGGRVTKLHFHQCFDDEAGRRAALAAMESKWGRVVPSRSADDRPVFSFALPGRRVEMVIGEDSGLPGWHVTIAR